MLVYVTLIAFYSIPLCKKTLITVIKVFEEKIPILFAYPEYCEQLDGDFKGHPIEECCKLFAHAHTLFDLPSDTRRKCFIATFRMHDYYITFIVSGLVCFFIFVICSVEIYGRCFGKCAFKKLDIDDKELDAEENSYM